jgi:hypothetical protein
MKNRLFCKHSLKTVLFVLSFLLMASNGSVFGSEACSVDTGKRFLPIHRVNMFPVFHVKKKGIERSVSPVLDDSVKGLLCLDDCTYRELERLEERYDEENERIQNDEMLERTKKWANLIGYISIPLGIIACIAISRIKTD